MVREIDESPFFDVEQELPVRKTQSGGKGKKKDLTYLPKPSHVAVHPAWYSPIFGRKQDAEVSREEWPRPGQEEEEDAVQ